MFLLIFMHIHQVMLKSCLKRPKCGYFVFVDCLSNGWFAQIAQYVHNA